jgi:GDP/UDP-N,N'-diacetylbacillosamine 2-epimerase (hydrolysing)
MRSTLFAIKNNPQLRLSLIVTGMHLSKEFGSTIDEIQQDGFIIDSCLDVIAKKDTGLSMAEALADSLKSIAEAIAGHEYDLILLLGDRGDMLSASLAGVHLNTPVAHIGGGHKSGSVDDRLRDAITIFSDYHFTANKTCADRVITLGANPSNVFAVGAPDLDAILHGNFVPPHKIYSEFSLKSESPVILLSQHSVTTEVQDAASQMEETMAVIKKLAIQTIVIYPNSDAGGRQIVGVLKKYENLPFVKMYKSIPYLSYLGLMRVASVLIGNSSAGIIEAPSFGLPVVNIGTRQKGRERSENVIDCDYDRLNIEKAIKVALTNEFKNVAKKSINPYGDGKTGERISKILASIPLERYCK